MRTLRVHYAFAGGGAKGIAHVAFAKAVETTKRNSIATTIEDASFGGTSAGAIVACLLQAGYSPDELFDASTGKSKLPGLLGLTDFRQILGTDGPRNMDRLERLRALQGRKSIVAASIVSGFAAVYAAVYAIVVSLPPSFAAGAILVLAALAALPIRMLARKLAAGFWSTEHFERCLNRLLAQKLGRSEDELVLFAHLAPIPLRLVATNITTGQGVVFSNDAEHQQSQGVPVAKAVAASMAIPFLFKPVRIGNDLYCDGGMVSNLPIWTASLNPADIAATRIFAIDFPSYLRPDESGESRGSLDFLWRLLNATAFGAGEMEQRNGAPTIIFNMSPTIGTLDFAIVTNRPVRLFEDLTQVAATRLHDVINDYDLMHEFCDITQKSFADMLAPSAPQGTIRVTLLAPLRPHNQSLRVMFGSHHLRLPDTHYLVPVPGTAEGEAFVAGRPILKSKDPATGTTWAGWPQRKWVWSVPFIEMGRVSLLLRIDSDIDFANFSLSSEPAAYRQAFQGKLAQALLETIAARTPELR